MLKEFRVFFESKEKYSKVNQILDSGTFVFFFKKDGKLYGAPEDSRITFAKLIHPDEEDGRNWVKEATFTAACLDNVLGGTITERVFSKKDIKSIKVIDKETVAEDISNRKD